MKRYFFLFFTIFLLTLPLLAGEPESKAQNYTGTYILSHHKRYNTLEIFDFGDGRIKFHVLSELHLTDRSGNVPKGDSCGGIYLKGNQATYESTDGTCTLIFTFNKDTVQVTQTKACYDFHVRADGLYTKKNSEDPSINCK